MEPCCALKYYPAVDACQSEKVPSITLSIKIDKITCHNLKANPPLLSTAKIGGNLMAQNCQKLEKYLFLGISGRILAPATGGPGKSSYPEGSEYVWQRGVGSQKCLVRGNFQSVPCYRKRADQKPPIARHF